jgi:hypothetical protein
LALVSEKDGANPKLGTVMHDRFRSRRIEQSTTVKPEAPQTPRAKGDPES